MFSRKPKVTKLPQNQADFDALSLSFLEQNGFPVTAEYQAFFAAHVQSLSGDEDSFDALAMAKRMRRSRVNELAYYLIHPEKRPQPVVEESKDEAPKSTPSGVE